jgi:hypothetical protein
MPTFKRASLGGSEDLFRPTRPTVVNDTDDVIKDAVDRPVHKEPVVYRTFQFTSEDVELLLDAIQAAKYPDRPKPKPPLDKFDALDALRLKIQGDSGG